MSRLGSLYIKLGEPEGEMPGCCETADWAAGYIEELQSELNEQVRLLGMSVEGELKLIAEIEQARRTAEYWKSEHLAANAEIERLRAEITTREDGAEKMALKGIEMRNEIDALRAEIDEIKRQEPVAKVKVQENNDGIQ